MTKLFDPNTVPLAAQRTLRCRKTHRYFTGSGWTPEKTEAKCFADEFDAAMACVKANLKEVDLVLSLPGGHADLFSTWMR